jgi:hypothetical protein
MGAAEVKPNSLAEINEKRVHGTRELRMTDYRKGSEGPLKFGDAMVSHFQGVYW